MTARAGFLDRTGRGLVRVAGPDRASFLQGMLSNDVAGLRPGQGCRALMLTVKGKIVADVFIYLRENDVLLETDEGRGAPLCEGLEGHLVMEDAEVRDETARLGVLLVVGPDAFHVAGLAPLGLYEHRPVGEALAAGMAYAGVPAIHFIAPREHISALATEVERAGASRTSETEVEAMRIEAGWPRWGRELGEDTLPLEAGLADALSFTKGCYTGQEVIARVSARGHVNWTLVGLSIEGGPPPAPGTVLAGDGRPEAARVTSSCQSSRLGQTIALAYAFRTHAAPGTMLSLPDGRHARVVALPFSAESVRPA